MRLENYLTEGRLMSKSTPVEKEVEKVLSKIQGKSKSGFRVSHAKAGNEVTVTFSHFGDQAKLKKAMADAGYTYKGTARIGGNSMDFKVPEKHQLKTDYEAVYNKMSTAERVKYLEKENLTAEENELGKWKSLPTTLRNGFIRAFNKAGL